MTLLRLIQRASILAGMTLASLPVHSNPARAEITEFCIIASNGKTVCGKSRGIERMCVTTNGSNTVCGKFKSAKEGQGQEEASNPLQGSGFQKEVNNFVLTLESCKRVDEDIRCQMKILNKGKTRTVYFNQYDSSIIDSMGRSHSGSKADFGSLGSNSANIDTTTDIIASVIFEKVPSKVVKAQLLNLAFYREIKPIQFRDVPFSN